MRGHKPTHFDLENMLINTRNGGCSIILTGLLCLSMGLHAQKSINQNPASWTGVFASYRTGEHFGFTGDFLINRNNFYADPGFTWLKIAPSYWGSGPNFFSAGLALLWVPRPDLSNASHTLEYRFDPQAVTWKSVGRGTLLGRFRLDVRSRQNTADGALLNTRNMSYRFRYLISYTVPLSQQKNPISLVLLNEILIQFGSTIVYNTFDQARVFIGIHKRVSETISFDFGYFPIYSQLPSGNQYNLDHIIRLFIYADFKRSKLRYIPMPVMDFNEE
jgi:hypothetical protein